MNTPQVIDKFESNYSFLSNFAPSQIRLQLLGRTWVFATGEHAFQVAKVAVSDLSDESKLLWVEKMAANTEPEDAKHMGRSISIDKAQWSRISYITMRRVQELKYEQNSDLRANLLATESATLIEGNTWNDTLWGQVNGKGKNQLGIILMDLRKRLLFERLIDSAWVIMVEQQHHSAEGWSMAKSWAWDQLQEAFAPFRNSEGDYYDLEKIRAVVNT